MAHFKLVKTWRPYEGWHRCYPPFLDIESFHNDYAAYIYSQQNNVTEVEYLQSKRAHREELRQFRDSLSVEEYQNFTLLFDLHHTAQYSKLEKNIRSLVINIDNIIEITCQKVTLPVLSNTELYSEILKHSQIFTSCSNKYKFVTNPKSEIDYISDADKELLKESIKKYQESQEFLESVLGSPFFSVYNLQEKCCFQFETFLYSALVKPLPLMDMYLSPCQRELSGITSETIEVYEDISYVIMPDDAKEILGADVFEALTKSVS